MYQFEMLIESGSITIDTDDMNVIKVIQDAAAYYEANGWEVVEDIEEDEEEVEEDEVEEDEESEDDWEEDGEA
jgi:nucleosome binding factor SPN SPT16 subunit